MKNRYITRVALAVATALPALALAAPLAGLQAEIATAKVHATAASQIDTLAGAQLHLHHVINCLVGPHGAGYSARAEALSENHCDHLGNGAVADSTAEPATHQLTGEALQAAQAGLHATTLDAAHADAAKVLKLLAKAAP